MILLYTPESACGTERITLRRQPDYQDFDRNKSQNEVSAHAAHAVHRGRYWIRQITLSPRFSIGSAKRIFTTRKPGMQKGMMDRDVFVDANWNARNNRWGVNRRTHPLGVCSLVNHSTTWSNTRILALKIHITRPSQ